MKRTLAVLITYFNERELLLQCLQSIAAQRVPPDEILVYDDASEYPAANYVPPGLKVRVIRGQQNLGPSRGRNALWQQSQSDFIHFHDSDDWFAPDWGQRVRSILESEDPDAVFTEVSSHKQGQLYCEKVLGLELLRVGGDLVQYCLHNPLLVPSGTYRRSLVEAIGGYRTDLWQSEDYEFHVRMAARKPDYRLIFDPLVHIRLRAESRSQRFHEVWGCRLQALHLLTEELPPLYRHEMAEEASRVGSELFKIGELSRAREAFVLAHKLGPPEFHNQQPMYRWIAKSLGPETAEWVGTVYRRVLPDGVRKKLRANQK